MPAGPATAKAKKPVSLKKDNGVARGARMPKRLHAMKIYYRARGCWSNNRSHSGEERTERGEEKKARIFRLIDVINLGFFFVQISYPPLKLYFMEKYYVSESSNLLYSARRSIPIERALIFLKILKFLGKSN